MLILTYHTFLKPNLGIALQANLVTKVSLNICTTKYGISVCPFLLCPLYDATISLNLDVPQKVTINLSKLVNFDLYLESEFVQRITPSISH
jgi:hypothetical protein